MSLVRRIGKHQRVPAAEVRAAMASVDMTARPELASPRLYERSELFDAWPAALYIQSALLSVSASYLLHKGNRRNVNAGPFYAAGAIELLSLSTTRIDEMVIRAQLPRWTRKGRVTDKGIDAAAAAFGAGHPELAKQIVQREARGTRPHQQREDDEW